MGDAWNYINRGAAKVADYTPVVSNVKGLIEGDGAQAILGPVAPIADDTIIPALKKPYENQAKANEAAGKRLGELGDETYDLANAGLGRALDQTTPAARRWADTYEGDGGLAGPGVLEQYYQERRDGTSPDQLRSRELGSKAIGDAFAARGLNNSGAAIKAVGNLNADLGAAESRQMGELAARSQGANESRLGGAFDRLNNLGAGRAGIVQHGTDSAISNKIAGVTGQINGNLAGSASRNAFWPDMFKTATTLGGAYLGGAGGAAAGAQVGGAVGGPAPTPSYATGFQPTSVPTSPGGYATYWGEGQPKKNPFDPFGGATS